MEPARAGWSFNKWRKTRIPKALRQNSRRQQNVHARVEAPVAEAVPAAVVVAAAADAVGLAAVVPGAVGEPAAAVGAAYRAVAVRGAKAVSAAVEAVRARAAIAMADAGTVAASSSRT